MLIVKQIVEFFSNIIMAFRSLFWKRNNNVVLFGSWFGNRFADNSRFLFQFLSDHKNEYGLEHVVWVSRNEDVVREIRALGYEAYPMHSREAVRFHKLARYHFICESCNNLFSDTGDILGQYSYGAVRVNLWHGVGGLKNVKYAVVTNMNRASKVSKVKLALHDSSNFYRTFLEENGGWGNCYYLSTTDDETTQLMSYFRCQKDYCIESNYPRNCRISKMMPEERAVINRIKQYKYCVLYLPTFRQKIDSVDIGKIGIISSDALKHKGILWIQKSHVTDKNNTTNGEHRENYIELNPDFDINILLPFVSVIVTDYSSVCVDALYHMKPTVFYVPDIDQYGSKDRGFYEDVNKRLFGPKAMSIDDLISIIVDVCNDPAKCFNKNFMDERKRWWNTEKDMAAIWEDIKRYTER